jgi:predicted DNA-binding transcriptional regulator AlpA
MSGASDIRLPSGAVISRFGIHRRTLSRWMQSHELNFPKPLVINNRLYFKEAEIRAWEVDCARRRAGVTTAG